MKITFEAPQNSASCEKGSIITVEHNLEIIYDSNNSISYYYNNLSVSINGKYMESPFICVYDHYNYITSRKEEDFIYILLPETVIEIIKKIKNNRQEQCNWEFRNLPDEFFYKNK